MDALSLLKNEKFFYADCAALDQYTVVCYRVAVNHIELEHRNLLADENLTDDDNLADFFARFTKEINGSTYVGGETSAHSSCGFFYKTTQGILDWALVSLDSDPFVDVTQHRDRICFLSQNGDRWCVGSGGIANVTIERLP